MILSNIDKREIGLKLFKSCVEPPLCSGITLTILSFSGNIPLEKDTEILLNLPRSGEGTKEYLMDQ